MLFSIPREIENRFRDAGIAIPARRQAATARAEAKANGAPRRSADRASDGPDFGFFSPAGGAPSRMPVHWTWPNCDETRLSKRVRKWLALGAAGFTSGLVPLLLLRPIPMASGSAVAAVVAMIAIKHLALALAVSSPLAALFQSVRPAVRAHCPFANGDGG